MTPEAAPAREFLAERGFDRQVGAGLRLRLRPRRLGHPDPAPARPGLHPGGAGHRRAGQGVLRGTLIDRFHRRLVWPIRDLTGDVIGFGARKLMDDDPGPKYLNTPETPLYKKSTVLYGVERAKRDIARSHQAVVVEGYTDVMACHLAGVTTAVASCGTAFGAEHISVLRRLLMDQDEFRGEVVYTFDGDAAGQAAAMKSFKEDQRFVAQTFVAVEPDGPRPVRAAAGARRRRRPRPGRPAHPADRVRAADDARRLRPGHRRGPGRRAGARPRRCWPRSRTTRCARPTRAGWPGCSGCPTRPRSSPRVRRLTGESSSERPPVPARTPQRTPDDAALEVEREAVKAALQCPEIAGPAVRRGGAELVHHPDYAAVAAAVAGAGGAAGATTSGAAWLEEVAAHCDRDSARAMLTALAVEPLHAVGENDPGYVNALMARLHEMATVAGGRRAQGQAAAHQPGRGAGRVHAGVQEADGPRTAGHLAAQAGGRRADAVSLLDRVRGRSTRPPEQVRAVVAADADERVLAWGERTDGGWTVATLRGACGWSRPTCRWPRPARCRCCRGTRSAPPGGPRRATAARSPSSRWRRSSPASRRGWRRSGTCCARPGELPSVLKNRVDRTVVHQPAAPAAHRGLGAAGGPPGARSGGPGVDRRVRRRRGPRRPGCAPGGPGAAGGRGGRRRPGPLSHQRRGQWLPVSLPRRALTELTAASARAWAMPGGALQARVVLGVLVGAADLLVALPAGAGAEHVAGAEAGEEGQLGHEGPPGFGEVITLPAGRDPTRREPRPEAVRRWGNLVRAHGHRPAVPP